MNHGARVATYRDRFASYQGLHERMRVYVDGEFAGFIEQPLYNGPWRAFDPKGVLVDCGPESPTTRTGVLHLLAPDVIAEGRNARQPRGERKEKRMPKDLSPDRAAIDRSINPGDRWVASYKGASLVAEISPEGKVVVDGVEYKSLCSAMNKLSTARDTYTFWKRPTAQTEAEPAVAIAKVKAERKPRAVKAEAVKPDPKPKATRKPKAVKAEDDLLPFEPDPFADEMEVADPELVTA